MFPDYILFGLFNVTSKFRRSIARARAVYNTVAVLYGNGGMLLCSAAADSRRDLVEILGVVESDSSSVDIKLS